MCVEQFLMIPSPICWKCPGPTQKSRRPHRRAAAAPETSTWHNQIGSSNSYVHTHYIYNLNQSDIQTCTNMDIENDIKSPLSVGSSSTNGWLSISIFVYQRVLRLQICVYSAYMYNNQPINPPWKNKSSCCMSVDTTVATIQWLSSQSGKKIVPKAERTWFQSPWRKNHLLAITWWFLFRIELRFPNFWSLSFAQVATFLPSDDQLLADDFWAHLKVLQYSTLQTSPIKVHTSQWGWTSPSYSCSADLSGGC